MQKNDSQIKAAWHLPAHSSFQLAMILLTKHYALEVFPAGDLSQDRLLYSKIDPLETGISENQAQGIYMILPF